MSDTEMICGCHQVTLKDIKEEIASGVKTFVELQEKTKIGTDCLPCKEHANKVFDELKKASTN